MYVRDELGGFSECAYSLLLSYRSSHPSRGGDWLSSWSPPRFVLCLTWRHGNIYLCVDALKAKECHYNLIHIYMSQDTTSQTSPLPASEEIRISSVSEFIEKIVQRDKEARTETFYRGHADKDWKLLPSIFRTPNGVEKEHLLFRDMVAHEPQSFSECKSALDYLVQMQHYGLPTRLLDMTTNPLVALYFACQSVADVVAGIFSGILIAAKLALETIQNDPRAKDFTPGELSLVSTIAYVAGALAAGPSVAAAHAVEEVLSVLHGKWMKNPAVPSVCQSVVESAFRSAGEGAVKASAKDGAVYLFTAPEDRVKHYDSDTISVLANLAKCKISEQCSAGSPSVEEFNKQADIARLCEQVKAEKPHFLPYIQPCDLSSLFFVKAKNGNQRIVNQMGTFLLFGLGLNRRTADDDAGEVTFLTKSEHIEVPVEWIKKKLIIPKECKADILKELALLGITESYIYPGIEQYAKELKKKYEL